MEIVELLWMILHLEVKKKIKEGISVQEA